MRYLCGSSRRILLVFGFSRTKPLLKILFVILKIMNIFRLLHTQLLSMYCLRSAMENRYIFLPFPLATPWYPAPAFVFGTRHIRHYLGGEIFLNFPLPKVNRFSNKQKQQMARVKIVSLRFCLCTIAFLVRPVW